MEARDRGVAPATRHVTLLVLPESSASTLFGVHDVLNAGRLMGLGAAPFRVEIAGAQAGRLTVASGVPVDVPRAATAIEDTDLVIVPSVVLPRDGWRSGRFPALVEWVRAVHARGAVLCSACSGIFLLAETGLFDGRDATVHYDYARAFAAAHPAVAIHPEQPLVIAGTREDLVSSGASTSWYDLVLYLLARFAGATHAQQVARLFALQWHPDGLAPYMVFEGRLDHGDAEIATAQRWLQDHFAVARPVEDMLGRTRLAERTFKRRFTAATGMAPIAYVQRLRVEDAKRRLERTDAPVDEIGWRVGYEDAAFFRRLFRRITGLAPGEYRRRFRVPDFTAPPPTIAKSTARTARRTPGDGG